MRRLVGAATASLLFGPGLALAQSIGTVAVNDATITGTSSIENGRATLVGASSVTARDHTAEVALSRGGTVRICQTSGVKLSSGSASSSTAHPLMLALDRGAIELKLNAMASDNILTPDLRFSVSRDGPLDLRVRVAANGDTCVEQRSTDGPTLVLSDTFGERTYEVHAGQHLLFEHGSLREVVDHETSPCGCPEPSPTVSLAQAALGASSDNAAAQHPFPAAESAGLAPTSEVPQAAPGVVHTQVAATLGYEGSEPSSAEPPPMALPHPAQAAARSKQQQHGFGHSIKHFFKRLFGGS